MHVSLTTRRERESTISALGFGNGKRLLWAIKSLFDKSLIKAQIDQLVDLTSKYCIHTEQCKYFNQLRDLNPRKADLSSNAN